MPGAWWLIDAPRCEQVCEYGMWCVCMVHMLASHPECIPATGPGFFIFLLFLWDMLRIHCDPDQAKVFTGDK